MLGDHNLILYTEVLEHVLLEVLILERDEGLANKMGEVEGSSIIDCEFFTELDVFMIDHFDLIGNEG